MKVKQLEVVCLVEDKSPHDVWVIGADTVELFSFKPALNKISSPVKEEDRRSKS